MFNNIKRKIELVKERQWFLSDMGRMVNLYRGDNKFDKDLIEKNIITISHITLLIKKQIDKLAK